MTEDCGKKFTDFLRIVARLRAADGCPWDRKQTPQSLKTYLIEEAHELLEALDSKNSQHVREELGDLLFLIVLLNQLHQEKSLFTMDEVLAGISEKMIRRHPHVFGNETSASDEELRKQWQAIKQDEKSAGDGEQTPFSSIPKTLPGLRRAQRVSERAARAGFEWPDPDMVFAKLAEELAELREAMAASSSQAVFEELGDVLFTVVNICRLSGNNAEEALNNTTEKFIGRFNRMEHDLKQVGSSTAIADSPTLLRLWQAAKELPAK
ncbi:MAG: nucleoside triphosphate pyrophosphohydrolase [Deltaproteobacteria bacterium RIFOXYD12_FULL_57_12]|nr:MAG: nucleoside triphosphate pyrophosphohydrolase [Deltaproteobacteria bacterium RIFOXYD12_FULL_57_12]